MNESEYTPELNSRKALVSTMVFLIVVAHVFMWFSDMPYNLKLTFTVLNAVGWTLVLAPLLLLEKLLDEAHNCNDSEGQWNTDACE